MHGAYTAFNAVLAACDFEELTSINSKFDIVCKHSQEQQWLRLCHQRT
jgi:hypothetical protein